MYSFKFNSSFLNLTKLKSYPFKNVGLYNYDEIFNAFSI